MADFDCRRAHRRWPDDAPLAADCRLHLRDPPLPAALPRVAAAAPTHLSSLRPRSLIDIRSMRARACVDVARLLALCNPALSSPSPPTL